MIGRHWAVIALPVLVALAATAEASEWARLSKQDQGAKPVAAQPQHTGAKLYTSKQLGFSMAVPPGGDIVEREGTNQVSVRARKGYVINVQVGPKRPQVPLPRMSTLLEVKYLGDGKPWSARGADRPLEVAGLPAHDVAYTGTGSKARVVVARGQVNDYVFIFIAPERAFKKLEPEFEWVLTNFEPNAKDRALPVVAVTPAETGAPAATQRFQEPGYGYVIDYPAQWKLSKPGAMATVFSGPEGSPDYAAIIGIQNIAPPGAKDPNEAARRAFNQLRASLGNAVGDMQVIEDRPWTYARPGLRLVGRQMVVTYRHAGAVFQKRMIVVPRPTGSVAHIWSYTAPQAQYAGLQPAADSMLQSWTILTARSE